MYAVGVAKESTNISCRREVFKGLKISGVMEREVR